MATMLLHITTIFLFLLLACLSFIRADADTPLANRTCGSYHINDTLKNTLYHDLAMCMGGRHDPYPAKDDMVKVDFQVIDVKLMKQDDLSNRKVFEFIVKYNWRNPFFSWNTSTYPTTYIHISNWYLWTPTLSMFYAYTRNRHWNSKVKLSYDGSMELYKSYEYDVDCRNDFHDYPKDTHECFFMLYFPRTTNSYIRYNNINSTVHSSHMKEWTLEKTLVVRNYLFGDQNHDDYSQRYYVVTTIRRNPALHHHLITIPSLIISLFILISLWVPAKNNQRFALTVLLLLCLFTQIKSVEKSLPIAVLGAPVILKYLVALLLMLLLCFITSIVTSLLRKQPANHPLLLFARTIFFHPFFQRILFVSHHTTNHIAVVPEEAFKNKKLEKMMVMLDEWVSLKTHESGFSDKLVNSDHKLVALSLERVAFVVVAVVVVAATATTCSYIV